MLSGQRFYHDLVKPIVDRLASAFGLIAIAPILLIIAVAVRCQIGSPVVFAQSRPGKHSRPFWLYKFRTMTGERDSAGQHLPDEQRLTPFGQFLRSTSLDELPELWNVLRGDMSLVGPRPLLVEYLDHYTSEQALRHEVKPGITGWAQINGRNSISWDERLALDAWYVRNRSFWLDVKILARTAVTVFGRRGVSADGHVTMPRFDSPKYDDRDYVRAA